MAKVKAAGIFLVNKNNEVLICHPTNHSMDIWGIPKGRLDKDETPLEAAIRETFEEANVNIKGYKIIHKLEEQTYRSKKKTIFPYLILEAENHFDFSTFSVQCNSFVEPEKGGFPEVDNFQWVSLDVAEQKLMQSQAASIAEIREIISQSK